MGHKIPQQNRDDAIDAAARIIQHLATSGQSYRPQVVSELQTLMASLGLTRLNTRENCCEARRRALDTFKDHSVNQQVRS